MIDGLDSYYQRIINNTQQHRLKRNAAKHYVPQKKKMRI